MKSPSVKQQQSEQFDTSVDVVIVGAGAGGLIAALAAIENAASVMVIERDASTAGSTALSAGLIPAAATRWQDAQGIRDSVELFVDDILNKSQCPRDRAYATRLAQQSATTLHWLNDRHGLSLSLVEGFTYPGHSVRRMHGTKQRTGRELMDLLLTAASNAEVDVVTSARVTDLFHYEGRITGVGIERGDGVSEQLGAGCVILACNGYGGNPQLVAEHIPEMNAALYFGHRGNTGDAVLWADQLNLATRHLGAYQGHGSVARPHGILISWAAMMEGGVQVNTNGERFSSEHDGYSEQAERVLAQPGGEVWNIFDQRIFDIVNQFEDFRDAVSSGAVRKADGVASMAEQTGLPEDALAKTLTAIDELANAQAQDQWGRKFHSDKRLKPPYYAVRVEGALFHTQGGLVVDENARVINDTGDAMPNLFAVGGAACGVSGPGVSGYLSGNGLLSAVALGHIAGRHAAASVAR